ncbi:MAG: stage III sporulation protein AE [Anaerovoracaceae bacterium]
MPLIKIILRLRLQATAALCEPVTDSKISDGLSDMGSCLISIGSIMFFNALLFIMFITTIMKIGGG